MYFTIKSKVKILYSCYILQYEICTNTGVYYMHTEVDKKIFEKDFRSTEPKSGNRPFFLGLYFSLNKEQMIQ